MVQKASFAWTKNRKEDINFSFEKVKLVQKLAKLARLILNKTTNNIVDVVGIYILDRFIVCSWLFKKSF